MARVSGPFYMDLEPRWWQRLWTTLRKSWGRWLWLLIVVPISPMIVLLMSWCSAQYVNAGSLNFPVTASAIVVHGHWDPPVVVPNQSAPTSATAQAPALPNATTMKQSPGPLECGIERETPAETMVDTYTRVDPVDDFPYTVNLYDTNLDGYVDASTRTLYGEDYPTYYLFDRKPWSITGQVDIVYEDTLKDGTCNGIVVVYVRGKEEADEQRESGGGRGPIDKSNQV